MLELSKAQGATARDDNSMYSTERPSLDTGPNESFRSKKMPQVTLDYYMKKL